MSSRRVIAALLLFCCITTGFSFEGSFVPQQRLAIAKKATFSPFQLHLPPKLTPGKKSTTKSLSMSLIPFDLRGGAATALVSKYLHPGPLGILTLWGVASSVVVPLTIYRRAYSFSVGYGLSVFAMGLALTLQFVNLPVTTYKDAPLLLAGAIMFYGLRLGSYLFIREKTSELKSVQLKQGDKDNPWYKRFPLALGVSLFYAFMTTPALFALGTDAPLAAGSVASNIASAGTGLAWTGALLEAVADGQKLFAKRNIKKDDANFVGPTEGSYRICRHPNYLGEILFWLGVFVGGAPFMGRNVAGWVCSSLGLYGIVNLMMGAASRLDDRQQEKYGGQPKYDEWKTKVKASLFPFVS